MGDSGGQGSRVKGRNMMGNEESEQGHGEI